MKVVGIIPARMASSRFPGKPLFPIMGRPMVEHVFCRSRFYKGWDGLFLATCDKEIADFAKSKDFPAIMTSDKHTRCLDRVAEAVEKCGVVMADSDVVVCVQGDEPMFQPDMIDAVLKPLQDNPKMPATVLAMEIIDEEQWKNPDTVKIIHNDAGEVLYTSRAPIPYCKKFSKELGARRIYGIFAFRWQYLKAFTQTPEKRLEIVESCDSNRILDMDFSQYIAPYRYLPSFSVDSPSDVGQVEAHIKNDAYWGKY